MRVVFMGSPDFAVPALDAVAAAHEVCAVYTQPPRPAGRGQQPRPCPVQARAQALGLPVRHPARLRDAADQADFAALGADVAVVVAYGLILPQAVLDAPRLGCLNIHASLLPRWRGAAPIHRAVMAGDAETGICIMQMEAGLDTGPVLMRASLPIGPETTTGDLHDALAPLGARLIVQALAALPGLTATPQIDAETDTCATYAAKIDKAEARIDWTRPAETVDRQIRGLSPFPGAWCVLPDGERLKLSRSRNVPDGTASAAVPPGTIVDPGPDSDMRLIVACGSGAVEVLAAQRAGKRPAAAAELLRGLRLPPGTTLA
jgi:methionyl-tRNA formyltransferase